MPNLQGIFYVQKAGWEKPLYFVRERVTSFEQAEAMCRSLLPRFDAIYASVSVENWTDLRAPAHHFECGTRFYDGEPIDTDGDPAKGHRC